MLLIMTLLFFGCQTEDLKTSEIEDENAAVENLDISLLNDKDYIQTAELNEKLVYKELCHIKTSITVKNGLTIQNRIM